MSATRPSRKPTVAPATGPGQQPDRERHQRQQVGARVEHDDLRDDGDLQHDHRDHQDGAGGRCVPQVTFTASPARSATARRVARQDLDHVELAQVRERAQVHALVQLALVGVDARRHAPIGMPRGNSDSSRDERQPDVTTVAPLRTARPFCTKSRIRSFGFPTVAFTSPLGPSGTSCADTPLV